MRQQTEESVYYVSRLPSRCVCQGNPSLQTKTHEMLINNTLFGSLVTVYLLVCHPVFCIHQQVKGKPYFCQKERWLIFFLLVDILLVPILMLPVWFPLRVELSVISASCLLYNDCVGAEKIYLRFVRPCFHHVDLQAHRLLSTLETLFDGDTDVPTTTAPSVSVTLQTSVDRVAEDEQ